MELSCKINRKRGWNRKKRISGETYSIKLHQRLFTIHIQQLVNIKKVTTLKI